LAVPFALAKMLRIGYGTGNERKTWPAPCCPERRSSAREPNRRPQKAGFGRRAAYLVSVGLVAPRPLGVFFGMGFLVVDYTTNQMGPKTIAILIASRSQIHVSGHPSQTIAKLRQSPDTGRFYTLGLGGACRSSPLLAEG